MAQWPVQAWVEDHLGDIDGVLAVHDDITIAGKGSKEYDTILSQILNHVIESNIKFNKSKIQNLSKGSKTPGRYY